MGTGQSKVGGLSQIQRRPTRPAQLFSSERNLPLHFPVYGLFPVFGNCNNTRRRKTQQRMASHANDAKTAKGGDLVCEEHPLIGIMSGRGIFQDFNQDSSHAKALRTVTTIVPD